MVTSEKRGMAWVIKRNGIEVLVLMRRVTRAGEVEFYDWQTRQVVGSDLATICSDLEKEMEKAHGANNGSGDDREHHTATADGGRGRVLCVSPGRPAVAA